MLSNNYTRPQHPNSLFLTTSLGVILARYVAIAGVTPITVSLETSILAIVLGAYALDTITPF